MVSWGAIAGGFCAAISLQILFMLLGAGLGLAIYSPLTDENPAANLGAGMVVVEGISAVVSLWFGGWVAGRLTHVHSRVLGGLHGFLVWSVATIAGILLVAGGAKSAVGGLARIAAGGMSAVGKPLAAAAEGEAKKADGGASTGITSFVDEAVASRPNDSSPASTIRAKREIGAAVANYFNPSAQNDTAASKAALVKTLSNNGMSEADANRTVADWTTSYEQAKAEAAKAKEEAEAKARVAADKAAETMSIVSFCTFAAFIIGAGAAIYGGEHGAASAMRRMNEAAVI